MLFIHHKIKFCPTQSRTYNIIKNNIFMVLLYGLNNYYLYILITFLLCNYYD